MDTLLVAIDEPNDSAHNNTYIGTYGSPFECTKLCPICFAIHATHGNSNLRSIHSTNNGTYMDPYVTAVFSTYMDTYIATNVSSYLYTNETTIFSSIEYTQ